jgi:hypothetical protein
MDTDLFKDNLKRIISFGKSGRGSGGRITRTVDVAVLRTSLELIEEYERVKRKLAAIEAISNEAARVTY